MSLQGTLGHAFDISAASGESTAWVLLWKTRSRPIGVRVCPVVLVEFFSTAFDPREWTMVVVWKEDSGRQLPLITPENEGRDETSSTSPPRFTFIDDPDVHLSPPDTPPAPLGHQIHLDYQQDCSHLLHLLMGEKEQEPKMHRVSDHDHDLNHQGVN